MKILFAAATLLFTTTFASAQEKTDWANFSKYATENLQEEKGKIVFMGNSITEGWKRSRPDFFAEHGYIGRGIGGQTSSQMLIRFRRDVIDLEPRAVVILAGTNDIAQNQGFITLENVLGNIVSMVELAQQNNIEVYLCSVLPAHEFKWRPSVTDASDQILQLNALIKGYAQSKGITYVDYHSVLKDSRNGLAENHAKDGVHPTEEAYQIMEEVLRKAIK